jgi:hypothetical protein
MSTATELPRRIRHEIGKIVGDAALKMTGPPAGMLVDD